jgi:glutamyl-tRNA reductase
LENSLATSDIVLVSTGATSHILSSPLMETVIRKRKYTPLFVIDISVPRNVHPSVNEIDNIFLYDIDDLQSVVSGNMEERQKEAALAEQIVHQEVQNFRRISQRQMVGPLVSSVRQRLEEICLEELQKEGDGLDQDEYQKIEKMLRRTAHRIAHPLMIQIKKIHDDPNRQYHNIEMIKEAFDLDEQK